MTNLTSKVKDTALMNEMDYVGVASIDRLKNAPEGRRPNDLLSKSRSVISIGVKIGEGVAEANRKAYRGVRHGIYIYMMFGYILLNEKLNWVAYRMARLLEKEGFRATPIPASSPLDYLELKGAVSHRHVAVAAGVGEFGWNTLLVTPNSGPRVRLATVLTDAKLESDPMYSGSRLCDPEKCGFVCKKVCPVKAFGEGCDRVEIGDRVFEYSKLDRRKCLYGVDGLAIEALGLKRIEVPEAPSPEDYLKAVSEESPWQKKEGAAGGSFCGRCIIHCPVGKARHSFPTTQRDPF